MSGKKRTRINQDITARRVRVIDAEGEQLGVITIDEARESAKGAGLDLVEVSPNADPPVCRIMNYGKYRFDQSKRNQKQRQKRRQVKEMKFRIRIDVGDYQIKLRKLIGFLEEGDKIKVSIRFRGREIAYQNLGMELIDRIVADLSEYAEVEQAAKMEGRQLLMVMAPKLVKKT